MPRCEDYTEYISAAIDGELSPQQRAQLDDHLAQCPACRALMDDLAQLHAGLGALPLAEPPQGLNESIMAAVRDSNVTPFPAKKPLYWKKWLSSAAVLALIAAAGWSWRVGSSRGASSAVPLEAAPSNTTEQSVDPDAAVPEVASATGSESRERRTEPTVSPQPVLFDDTILAEGDSYSSSNSLSEPAVPQAKAATAPSEAPAETALAPVEESGPVVPRMFSVQGIMATNEETGESSNGMDDLGQPSDLPATFVLTSAPPPEQEPPAAEESPAPAVRTAVGDGPAPLMAAPPVTAEEAVTALANYIYEFVGNVELLPASEDDAVVYAVDSPTGVSGTIALTGEEESLFLLEYRDSEGGEALCYTVDKTDAKVTWLGEASAD